MRPEHVLQKSRDINLIVSSVSIANVQYAAIHPMITPSLSWLTVGQLSLYSQVIRLLK